MPLVKEDRYLHKSVLTDWRHVHGETKWLNVREKEQQLMDHARGVLDKSIRITRTRQKSTKRQKMTITWV